MQYANFQLAGAESMTALRDLMRRTGWTQDPEQFITLVSSTFQSVQGERGGAADMHARFRRDPCYPVFVEALRQARERAPRPRSVLVIGCGTGYAGCGPDYAASVAREIFPPEQVPEIAMQTICAGALPAPRECDLLVSHSFLHFVPDLRRIAEWIAASVAAGGIYVMGHEPNARFAANRECAAVRAAALRSLRARSLLRSTLRRVFGRARTRPLSAQEEVNRILVERHGFRCSLSAVEISRIADPHFPVPGDSRFRIGLEGFDWSALLPGFELAWTGTSGMLGVIDRSRLSRKWLREEERLRRKYPLDGSGFSGVWTRR